jgi:hypothetical protein
MQSASNAKSVSSGDRNVVDNLIGGLTLFPYGIYLLLSALAFLRGWLDWETNNGPPFLGFVLAWLSYWFIRKYYKRVYGFSFGNGETESRTLSVSGVYGILLFIALILIWLVDANFDFQVRLLSLLVGGFLCWRGMAWIKSGWKWQGWAHLITGCFVLGMSVSPAILDVPTDNMLFGFEGVIELCTLGVAVLIVSILEHSIFAKIHNAIAV